MACWGVSFCVLIVVAVVYALHHWIWSVCYPQPDMGFHCLLAARLGHQLFLSKKYFYPGKGDPKRCVPMKILIATLIKTYNKNKNLTPIKMYMHNWWSIYQTKDCETTFLTLSSIAYMTFNRPTVGKTWAQWGGSHGGRVGEVGHSRTRGTVVFFDL